MRGIIVADQAELAALDLPKKFQQINQFKVFDLLVENQIVKLIISGVGLANAAAATQLLISVFNVKALYNFGSVGAYGTDLAIGQIVLPEQIYLHDVQTPWYERGVLPYEKSYYQNSIPVAIAKNYARFNLASGNSFMTQVSLAEQLATTWKVRLYDMEAAAIAQIAAQNKVSFTCVKSVSDLIGSTAQHALETLNKSIAQSAARSYELILEIIKLANHL